MDRESMRLNPKMSSSRVYWSFKMSQIQPNSCIRIRTAKQMVAYLLDMSQPFL